MAARARDRDFSSSAISNHIKHTPQVMDNIYFSELSMAKKEKNQMKKVQINLQFLIMRMMKKISF